MSEKSLYRPLRIGFLLFDGMTALDVVGPMEAFAAAHVESVNAPEQAYELVTIGLRRSDVVAESGLVLRPRVTLTRCPRLDTLIVPGGEGLPRPGINAVVADRIGQRASITRRIASVCTGIFGLAPTGLVDGRSVATHWRASLRHWRSSFQHYGSMPMPCS